MTGGRQHTAGKVKGECVEMDFYERMGHVCQKIPYGKVATYGQIAMLCGKPKNARQVGYGLRRGLAAGNVPAHRIVNSAGILSGAAFFETPDQQKILLEGEGIALLWTKRGWKVDLQRYGWQHGEELAEELYLMYEYSL